MVNLRDIPNRVRQRIQKEWDRVRDLWANRPGQRTGRGNNNPIPPYDQIYSWSTSFEKLMSDPVGRYYFTQFAKTQYNEENIRFWEACEDMKSITNPQKVAKEANRIYRTFVSMKAKTTVSLTSHAREITNTNMAHPTVNTFDVAQREIYRLMHGDTYHNFLSSDLYKDLLGSHGQLEEV